MAFHLAPELEHQAAGGVLVVDFGAQYSQLIARRVRECRVFSAIVPHDVDPAEVARIAPGGIILSGGPASVYEDGAPALDRRLLELGIPVLGICYGMQSMAQALGGVVTNNGSGEFGRTDIRVLSREGLFRDLPADTCWMSHRDAVTTAPDGFTVTAQTQGAPIAAMEDRAGRRFGVQFHPEVVHTPFGTDLLKSFLFDACDLAPTWTPANVIDDQVTRIREQVGDQKAICGLSGGVDSAVGALLVHRAIGDKLTCVFVDHGMLRMNEGEQVEEAFGHHFHVPLVHVRAQDQFLSKLAGFTDPEQKRKIIGAAFIDVFDEEAKNIGGADFLAQGTLYPDVIESVSFIGGPSVTIKSHHNVGGLPARMKMALVEPLRELFKDEVRALGRELGIPEELVGRHPFPGPGLAIRMPGEITREKAAILRRADAVYIDEIRKAGLYDEIWQAFAVLLPVRTVGVMGDARTYDYVCALRAVTSTDGMTADSYPFEHEFLSRVATRIINEVRGINRVTYDVTSKPPGTIEWE